MITSFFNKTNPNNYLFLFLLLIINAATYLTIIYLEKKDTSILTEGFVGFLALFFSTIMLNLTIRRLNLHKQHLYGGFVFAVFTFFTPNLFLNINASISLFLLSFAIYRLFHLKAVKAAIFEFSFLIICAAFFNYWMLLYLFFLVIFIMFFNKFDFKNLLIPIVAFLAILIIVATIDILFNLDLKQTFLVNNRLDFNIENFSSTNQRLIFSMLVTFIMLFVVFYYFQSEHIPSNIKAYYSLFLILFIFGVIIFLVDDKKQNENLILAILPVSVFGGKYIENLKDKKFGGFISWTFVVTAIIMFILSL